MQLSLTQLSTAFRLAAARGVLPTVLGSAELRDSLVAGMWRNAVYSATTAHVAYLDELKTIIDRLLAGGKGNDLPQLRLELKRTLQRLGYTPEGGFPGEAHLDIAPAEAGSIQDLSSDARLNLILRTQRDLATGKATQLAGFDALALHYAPAWELIRLESRRVPRGSPGSGSLGWGTRWVECGGQVTDDGPKSRMIALKTSPIWAELGSSARFYDALNVDHPPFAYRSGYGWVPVTLGECKRLGIDSSEQKPVSIVAWDAPEGWYGERYTVSVAASKPPVNLPGNDADLHAKALAFLQRFDAFHGKGSH